MTWLVLLLTESAIYSRYMQEKVSVVECTARTWHIEIEFCFNQQQTYVIPMVPQTTVDLQFAEASEKVMPCLLQPFGTVKPA